MLDDYVNDTVRELDDGTLGTYMGVVDEVSTATSSEK